MTTADARPTPTVEDYLGVIYTLSRDGEDVTGRKLAEWLEVSPPTVTETLQRMVRDGWVTRVRGRRLGLTPKGDAAARSVVRRHMLTELLLARVLDIPWSRVHEEADRLEHDLSSETADRVAEMVDDPSTCPHGNPMPGSEPLALDYVPLLEAEAGVTYAMARIHEEIERNAELMAFLEHQCLVPGAEMVIKKILAFNETVVLESNGQETVLGLNIARRIWVRKVEHAEAK